MSATPAGVDQRHKDTLRSNRYGIRLDAARSVKKRRAEMKVVTNG
ncbi:hypothetical protein [Rhizobium mesoamericanum]|nr:hypothetical protein [Rhizobium mesoamericanum]